MKKDLLSYIQKAIGALIEQDEFDNGWSIRKTQKEALRAYQAFLYNEILSPDERLEGFLEIPTGVGKTALFSAIIGKAHQIAEADNHPLKTIIVVPKKSLLTQTKDDLQKFVPSMENNVGLYGGQHKNLEQPVTVMTYEAWYDLSRTQEIGSHNIDILISDESHKGTSEKRIYNIQNAFDDRTARIAVTATADFDKVKSVRQSHKRKIFSKSIREAMQEGTEELAAYVSSQRLVIRVSPTDFMFSDEFHTSSRTKQSEYRRRIKQNTWNQYAHQVFKNGIDEFTGHPLTDNQAAFFVDGIAQADNLENLLNNDPILQKRAKENGHSSVALAIHSNLSDAVQEKRFQAYREGKCLAIVGDEMFKEGFDHAPLKTIIDYSHGSLVDKVQILGRGTRKWWNDRKNWFEGLSVIDTVIYIGSSDDHQDTLLRRQALRNAISVRDILGESFVIPDCTPVRRPEPSVSKIKEPFSDDPNIEYYASAQDTFRLDNEISRYRREDWVDITETLKKDLQAEAQRVGTTKGIISYMSPIPEGMHDITVYNIVWGAQKTAPPEHIEAIQNTFAGMKTSTIIKIDNEIISELLAEKKRTGVAARFLMSHMKDKPEGLTTRIVENILLREKTEAPKEYIDAMLKTYGCLRPLSHDEKSRISDAKKAQKISVKPLLENIPKDANFTKSELQRILNRAKTIFHTDTIDSVIDYIFPDSRFLRGREPINADDIQKISDERERTGIGFKALTKIINKTKALHLSRINAIFYGNKATTKPGEMKTILDAYASLPDKNAKPSGPEDSLEP